MPVNDLIQLRKGTDSVWSSINPVLSSGEPGYDSTFNILKVGDGTSTWSNLNPVNLSGTYFNNAVSGLLPVKNIVAGSDISVSNISGIYTITNTMTEVDKAATVVTTVFNKTGSSIAKMTAVYIDGGQGDMPTIQKAIATSDATSAATYGVTYEAIDNMSTGKVIVLGALSGLNTDQFNPSAPAGNVNGTILYLSPTTSGALTTTKPYAPNHIVAIATIVRTHQNEGVIEVRIQNGFELEELHNVAVTGATNGQFLQYNSSSRLWIPSSSGNFTTLQVNSTGVSLSGHTHTSSNITDWNEAVDDRVSNLLVAGSGINLNYNDSNNTLTVNLSVVAVTGYEILSTNKSSFTVSQGYISNNLNVYLNGSKLVLGQDYTASDGSTFDLVQTASSGDVVEWQGIGTPAIIDSTIDGNGTSNYLTKWADSNTLTNGIIYDNGTNIGIGTTSPTFKLDVIGSGAFTGNVSVSGKIIHPSLTGINDFIIYSQGDDTLIGAKAGNNVRIRAGGNDASYETIISSSYMYIGGLRIKMNSTETVINDLGDNYDFRVEGDNDQNLLFLDASTDRFGVGTNSPSYKLDVIGTGNFSQNLLINGTGVSLSGHTHSSSQITDFNSSVSGLLPVKNIVAGSGISLSISDGAYTINSSGTSNLNTEDVMDIMGTGLIAGTGISVVYNDTNGTITVSLAATTITGYEILTTTKDTFTVTPNYLIGNLNVYYNGFKLLNNEDYTATDGSTFVLNAPGASGDVVEWVGLGEPGQYASLNHTHSISDITNFGSGVSGLLPTIANSGNNRILTSTGSSTGINAESNFTFDGTSLSHHAGNFANAGDAQHTILVARRTTTDSTADVVLTLDGNTPGASNRPTIPAQSVWTFSLKLSAYNDTDSLGAWWIIRGGIRRNGANGTALVGSLVVENDSEGAMSGTSATVVADDTNEALEIRVTGLSSKNIRWVGVLDISQVSYGTP